MNTEKPRVINKHIANGKERDEAIYIGRGSPYGNKHHISEMLDRAEVIRRDKIDKVRSLLNADGEISIDKVNLFVVTFKSRNVTCFCSPQPCHGDWIVEIANHPVPIEFLKKTMKELDL